MKKLFLYVLLFVGIFSLCFLLANEYFKQTLNGDFAEIYKITCWKRTTRKYLREDDIDYFETLPSTKRIQDIVWENYILQKD